MKYVLTILVLSLGINIASAQEVYNSTGKPGHKKSKETHVKGFDPSRLVFGGGAIAGFGTGYANVGVSPIVGYRLTDRFAAGVGLGYEYLKQPQFLYNPSSQQDEMYSAQANIISPSIWARYQAFRTVFFEGTFEYNLIYFSDYNYDNNYNIASEKLNVGVPCLLLGGGVKQPISDRASFVIEFLYDVLQQDNSPYFGIPVLRAGIVVGL